MPTTRQADHPNPFLSVVIPAYNEEHRLLPTLQKVTAYLAAQTYRSEVLVSDDGSSDGTVALVRDFMAKIEAPLRVIENKHRGKGSAVRAGMLAATGEYRFMCDADLSMPIEEMARFLPPALEGVDVAIGTREGTRVRVNGSTDKANCSSDTAPSGAGLPAGPNRQVVWRVRPLMVSRISVAAHSSWRPSASMIGTRHWGASPRASSCGIGRQVNIAPVSTINFTSTGGESPRGLATSAGYVNVLIATNYSIRNFGARRT